MGLTYIRKCIGLYVAEIENPLELEKDLKVGGSKIPFNFLTHFRSKTQKYFQRYHWDTIFNCYYFKLPLSKRQAAAQMQAVGCSDRYYLGSKNFTNDFNLEMLRWYLSKNQNFDQCLDKVFRMWFQWNIMVSWSAHSWEKRLETCFGTIRMFHLLSWITRNKVRAGFWNDSSLERTINIH